MAQCPLLALSGHGLASLNEPDLSRYDALS